MAEEWGPWVEHDGRGCPLPDGTLAMRQRANGQIFVQIVLPPNKFAIDAWRWSEVPPSRRIIRYRVRKPRGMKILQGLLADLPEKVDA